ncbi:type I-E CRISPR-associated protein Cas7/Cse4/CasC [Desulfobacter postgatei]|uniref:CRISPR-associated protein Cas7/Cse4/CasC n=1 Tax=Desulfobacter postgatei 2ac9 TaxID=879212 RepID=I5B5J9_9BACT|nr:type I-E CRISPR-associated protein Cas7/Cse4/CasC [Desulfobacter postgatei]EIM64762.1 CRISPR-associated protein Cas7/Cse4/CasC [Desulfobacter postgatei 2ac9]
MNLIELHILQSFPVSCLNRDDVGAPKTAYFGGCQRARVSSQAWKRPIRAMAKESSPGLFAGQRTRFVVRSLEQIYLKKDLEPQKAKTLAILTADSMGKLDDPEKGNVKTLLYFSPQELESVTSEVLDKDYAPLLQAVIDDNRTKKDKSNAEKNLKVITDKASKQLKAKVKDNADIAVFGRMVADDHSLMVEGAGLFSHALSTHSVANEIDFFSAVDDNNTADDEGAGHLGTIEFNSACYYRYVGLNIDMLKDEHHLDHYEDDEFNQVVKTFLKAAILAVPSARKNSMFAFNPPAYVLGLKRNGQPLSLVNAFEKPVRKSRDGYIEESIDRMNSHWENLAETYCLRKQEDVKVVIPEKNIDDFIMVLMNKVSSNG